MTVTPDGRNAVSVTNNGELIVWDLQNGAVRCKTRLRDGNGVSALLLGGRWIISASSDYNLMVWDIETEEELFKLSGHNYFVEAIAVTPDGRRDKFVSADSS